MIPFKGCITCWSAKKGEAKEVCNRIQDGGWEVVQKKLPREMTGVHSQQRGEGHSLRFARGRASRTP